jgi:hypothetical protein
MAQCVLRLTFPIRMHLAMIMWTVLGRFAYQIMNIHRKLPSCFHGTEDSPATLMNMHRWRPPSHLHDVYF